MKPRRHRNHDRVHLRVRNGGFVALMSKATAKPPAVIVGARGIATGVPANDVGVQRLEMPAMDGGNEAAAEEREPERSRQWGHRLRGGSAEALHRVADLERRIEDRPDGNCAAQFVAGDSLEARTRHAAAIGAIRTTAQLTWRDRVFEVRRETAGGLREDAVVR